MWTWRYHIEDSPLSRFIESLSIIRLQFEYVRSKYEELLFKSTSELSPARIAKQHHSQNASDAAPGYSTLRIVDSFLSEHLFRTATQSAIELIAAQSNALSVCTVNSQIRTSDSKLLKSSIELSLYKEREDYHLLLGT